MIVATRDHMVRNRVVTINEHVTQEELHSIANYLNRNFSGWGLAVAVTTRMATKKSRSRGMTLSAKQKMRQLGR